MFLRRIFNLIPKDPFFEALDLINRGEFEAALPRLQGLGDSRNAGIRQKARLYACEAHLQLGDQVAATSPEEGLRHYQAASDLEPRFADIHNKVGETSRRLGRIANAEEAFRRALAINARYFAAQLNLAELLVVTGRADQALEELRRLETFCPPLYQEMVHDLVGACERGGPQDHAVTFLEIRKLMPTRLEVARQAAQAAIRRGEPEVAQRLVQDLLKEHPQFPDLHHILGLAYGELGRADDAILEFQTALAINPNFLKARINLGISLMEQGRRDEARRELLRVLEIDPANPLVESALAELAGARTGS
jgi:tetratricopeptide (TPR) repeat protein